MIIIWLLYIVFTYIEIDNLGKLACRTSFYNSEKPYPVLIFFIIATCAQLVVWQRLLLYAGLQLLFSSFEDIERLGNISLCQGRKLMKYNNLESTDNVVFKNETRMGLIPVLP